MGWELLFVIYFLLPCVCCYRLMCTYTIRAVYLYILLYVLFTVTAAYCDLSNFTWNTEYHWMLRDALQVPFVLCSFHQEIFFIVLFASTFVLSSVSHVNSNSDIMYELWLSQASVKEEVFLYFSKMWRVHLKSFVAHAWPDSSIIDTFLCHLIMFNHLHSRVEVYSRWSFILDLAIV